MVKSNIPDIRVPELIADMWAPLNEEQRAYLSGQFTLQTYKKNEVIHCEGETPKHLMCLLSGKVKIYKDGVGGRSQIIRMIKPVGYFGYAAYFAGKDYVTAAAAFEASTVCLIPMTAIRRLIAENNDLALFFTKQLSFDLTVADERTVNLTQKHIRGRLAESLLFLKESYGLEEDGSTLPLARGPGQPVQYDDLQRHPHIVTIRHRETHHHRRPQNQNHRRGETEENQQNRIRHIPPLHNDASGPVPGYRRTQAVISRGRRGGIASLAHPYGFIPVST